MWHTALKFFFPVLQITSPDHLEAMDEKLFRPSSHRCRLLFSYLTILGARLECSSNRVRRFISFMKQTFPSVCEEMFHVASIEDACGCLDFGLRKSTGSFLEQRLVVCAERAFRGVRAHFLKAPETKCRACNSTSQTFFSKSFFSIFFLC